jgi:hypothetical protein
LKTGRNLLEQDFYPHDNKNVPSPLKSTFQSKSSVTSKTSPQEIFLFSTFLVLVFLFRLAFGLCSEIWFIDQQQIYLIGLKYYTTGLWPYFGPDVAANIQLPGALQGLVVGLPLRIWSIPESPYIFLNLLSFFGLCFLAWYTCQRLSHFPRWIIWSWLLTAPWVLNWSTNIDNDSYVLFGSCLFFIGFLETLPPLTLNLVSFWIANYLMGFALGWNSQFHLSYVLLFPMIATSLAWQMAVKKISFKKKLMSLTAFLFGALATYSLVIPTWIQYGFIKGSGNTAQAITFNSENLLSFFTVLFRYLALACCEIPRFIGANWADRLAFLKENWQIAPFAIVAALSGLVQLVFLLVGWFRKKQPQKDWPAVKILTALVFVLIYVSFLFAIKTPAAHTYYLTLPLVMIYGFYALSPYVNRSWFGLLASILIICNLVFHAGLALHNLPVKSLYKNRDLFVKAIQEKNYQLLGERRPNTQY